MFIVNLLIYILFVFIFYRISIKIYLCKRTGRRRKRQKEIREYNSLPDDVKAKVEEKKKNDAADFLSKRIISYPDKDNDNEPD